MSTLGVSAMVLAGVVSTGQLPLDFQSEVQVRGAWVTAADVVRPVAGHQSELSDKLAQIRLVPVQSCADLSLSHKEAARRIVQQLPGVFAVHPGRLTDARVRIQVAGQNLGPDQLSAGIEQSEPRSCPPSMGRSCAVRLLQAPPALCVPVGEVSLRTDVAQGASVEAPLAVRVGVYVDAVRATTLHLNATAAQGFAALQLRHPVARGQALRTSDVLAVRSATPVAHRASYDATAHVVRVASDLSAGELVPAEQTPLLAQARAHDAVQLTSRVGPVQVSRQAHLASDAAAGRNAWAYFENGGLAVIRPAAEGTWELIR